MIKQDKFLYALVKTEQEWIDSDFILALLQEGFSSDSKIRKIGDGETLWKDLPAEPLEKEDEEFLNYYTKNQIDTKLTNLNTKIDNQNIKKQWLLENPDKNYIDFYNQILNLTTTAVPDNQLGIEYKIMELRNGRQLYRQYINFGVMPDNNLKSISHNIPDLETCQINQDKTFWFQTSGGPGKNVVNGSYDGALFFMDDLFTISCRTNNNKSTYTAYVCIEYTKRNDNNLNAIFAKPTITYPIDPFLSTTESLVIERKWLGIPTAAEDITINLDPSREISEYVVYVQMKNAVSASTSLWATVNKDDSASYTLTSLFNNATTTMAAAENLAATGLEYGFLETTANTWTIGQSNILVHQGRMVSSTTIWSRRTTYINVYQRYSRYGKEAKFNTLTFKIPAITANAYGFIRVFKKIQAVPTNLHSFEDITNTYFAAEKVNLELPIKNTDKFKYHLNIDESLKITNNVQNTKTYIDGVLTPDLILGKNTGSGYFNILNGKLFGEFKDSDLKEYNFTADLSTVDKITLLTENNTTGNIIIQKEIDSYLIAQTPDVLNGLKVTTETIDTEHFINVSPGSIELLNSIYTLPRDFNKELSSIWTSQNTFDPNEIIWLYAYFVDNSLKFECRHDEPTADRFGNIYSSNGEIPVDLGRYYYYQKDRRAIARLQIVEDKLIVLQSGFKKGVDEPIYPYYSTATKLNEGIVKLTTDPTNEYDDKTSVTPKDIHNVIGSSQIQDWPPFKTVSNQLEYNLPGAIPGNLKHYLVILGDPGLFLIPGISFTIQTDKLIFLKEPPANLDVYVRNLSTMYVSDNLANQLAIASHLYLYNTHKGVL